ncbi:EboA domain-containing protein [Streptomyces tropicalis]|uniref:EboA domain-containing protein n=1 Tax=Streptomyces tropicalis TaxID=3034234 RepID=A0ABT6AC59_9ACTN|nr:EboA domain-containing protein [Streptomyces tropicalis]MDF3302043.1 EboA domain-containing protein [Streptomyces tropicalis]
MTPDHLRTALTERMTEEGGRWLAGACASVAAEPEVVRGLFPLVGRRCGRGPLDPAVPHGWTVDDAARALLLTAVPLTGTPLLEEIGELYRSGDAAERRAVLRGLPLLPVGDGALPLVRDALRTNDTRLIAAALGDYATDHLDAESYRQGVLKCVFTGIPLTALPGLPGRADIQLARMMAGFAQERTAAGREVPTDIGPVLALFPDVRVPRHRERADVRSATTDRPSPREA